MKTLLILLTSLMAFVSVQAQPRGFMDDNPLRRSFLAPQMIMKFASELEITDKQRDVILKAQNESQARFNENRWKLHEEADALKALLESDKVDKKAAMTQLDKILALENDIKKDQLEMMIVLKNTLTPEQLKKAEEIREKFEDRRGNRRDGDGPRGQGMNDNQRRPRKG